MAEIEKEVGVEKSTEEKIKEAARTVFFKKGFAATRTRDIAEEAGINLALLNYYFRSKAKLFDIIMLETIIEFSQVIYGIVNNRKTSLEVKIEEIATCYIEVLLKEPEIPTFILAEIRHNPKELKSKFQLGKVIVNSYFFEQFTEASSNARIEKIHPLNFMLNFISLIVFPFIAKPLLIEVGGIKKEEFRQVMLERKNLIPGWIKMMVKPV